MSNSQHSRLDIQSERPRIDGQVYRTAEAIRALLNVNARPAVIFFKILDQLLVELGEPFGLRVSTKDGQAIQFDTIPSEQVSAVSDSVALDHSLLLTVLRPYRTGEDDQTRTRAITRATSFIEGVAGVLAEFEVAGRITSYGQRLLDGLRAASGSSANDEVSVSRKGCGVGAEEASRQLKDFFDHLETFLNKGDYHFELPGTMEPCPRFLLFHRFVGPNDFPTIRLHLLKSQSACLMATLSEGSSDLVEQRLGQIETSLTEAFGTAHWNIENSFSSGVTSWVDWPWRNRSGELLNAVGVARTAIDALVGGSLGDSSALVVPIHVNGLPWLALAGIFPGSEPRGSTWAGDFYRGLLPYLTTTVRELAERMYLREVRNRAKLALEAGVESLDELNNELASLTATYPYPRVALSKVSDRKEFDWRGESVAFADPPLSPLAIGVSPVTYTLLNSNEVVAALRNAQAEVDAAETWHRISSYIDIGHTLKNLVSSTGWATAAQQVAVVHRSLHTFERQGFDSKAIAKINTALSLANRSLSLFWTVEGLGHFIRLAGARSGKFDRSKFSDWLEEPSQASTRSDGLTLQAYGRSITHIAQAICFGWGWRQLTVTVANGNDPFIWSGDDPAVFSIRELHFPPFRKGSDGGYAFVFCLLEPIVNAVRALGALPAESPFRKNPNSLQISVYSDSSDPDAVVITVTNVSNRALPEKLSGLESTKNMMRDMGIGKFDPTPAARPLENGFYEITNRIRFYPKAITEAIGQNEGG